MELKLGSRQLSLSYKQKLRRKVTLCHLFINKMENVLLSIKTVFKIVVNGFLVVPFCVVRNEATFY